MSTNTIYTASDLKDRRTEILDAAQHGRALVRAVDGTALVLTTLHSIEHTAAVARWSMALVGLSWRASAPAELSWLRHLDNEDRAAFVAEAGAALEDAATGGPLAAFEQVLAEWRTTALTLADGARRAVLLGDVSDDDFDEVERPGGHG